MGSKNSKIFEEQFINITIKEIFNIKCIFYEKINNFDQLIKYIDSNKSRDKQIYCIENDIVTLKYISHKGSFFYYYLLNDLKAFKKIRSKLFLMKNNNLNQIIIENFLYLTEEINQS